MEGVAGLAGLVPVEGVAGLASLIPGEVAVGLAPDELPEESIAGLVVGSTLTAQSRGSVGGPSVDGRR